MSFASKVQLIVSSMVEHDIAEELTPVQISRQSISPEKAKVSISNLGQAISWKSPSPSRRAPKYSLQLIKSQHDKQRYPPFEKENIRPIKKINLIKIIKIMSCCFISCVIVVAFSIGIAQSIRPQSSLKWSSQLSFKGVNRILSFFMNKYSKNEYDTGFSERVFGHEGQAYISEKSEVISKIISNVSGIFKQMIHAKQHLIFAGVKEGVYLMHNAFNERKNDEIVMDNVGLLRGVP